jgi:hypothetical protein
MGRSTRRAVLQGTAAAAGLAVVQASGLAGSAQAGTGGGHPRAKALLVHGAWVDGSSWRRVIAILQRDGDNVVAVRLPLTSWGEEVAWTRQVLAERLQGPTVLAGHCDGGAVIAGAATGVEEVVGLVFASAFAPEEGRAWVGSGAGFRRRLAWPTAGLTRWACVVRSGGGPDRLRPGPPPRGGAGAGVGAKPVAPRAFGDPAGPPGWRTPGSALGLGGRAGQASTVTPSGRRQ